MMNTKTHDERTSVVVGLAAVCALIIVAALATFSSYQASASVSDEQTNPGISTPAKKSSFKVDKSEASVVCVTRG